MTKEETTEVQKDQQEEQRKDEKKDRQEEQKKDEKTNKSCWGAGALGRSWAPAFCL